MMDQLQVRTHWRARCGKFNIPMLHDYIILHRRVQRVAGSSLLHMLIRP